MPLNKHGFDDQKWVLCAKHGILYPKQRQEEIQQQFSEKPKDEADLCAKMSQSIFVRECPVCQLIAWERMSIHRVSPEEAVQARSIREGKSLDLGGKKKRGTQFISLVKNT